MNIYFKLPQIGDLMLEHEFYSLGNDLILFICKDRANLRYLCSCCHLGDEWVVGQASEEALIDLIDDRVSIREVFETSCDTLFLVVWDGERFNLEFDFPDRLLPKVGAFLELDEEKVGAFRDTLRKSMHQRKANQAVIAACQAMLPHMQNYAQTSVYAAQYVSQALQSTASMLKEISKYLSTIDTVQIQTIISTAIQHIDQSPQLDSSNSVLESEPIITIAANDDLAYQKICDDNEIYRYAA